jgi:hypothetical protein
MTGPEVTFIETMFTNVVSFGIGKNLVIDVIEDLK